MDGGVISQQLALYFAPGVLKQGVHERLVLRIDEFAKRAGIPKEAIYTQTLADACPSIEVRDWVMNYRQRLSKGSAGLAVVHPLPVDSWLRAVTGCFLRNFVDARYLTCETVINAMKDGEPPEGTVIVIPNLNIPTTHAGIEEWHASLLYDFMLYRQAAGLPVVLGFTAMNYKKMHDREHGKLLWHFMEDHYSTILPGAAK
jgi:hypothetical protein